MNPDPEQTDGTESLSEMFVWQATGQPFRIELAFDVIDRMTPDIADAFRALKRRGAEVGGILLGQVRQDTELTVTITDFVSIPIERKFGPSYHLSPPDLERFDKECAKWRPGTGANQTLVGYYRSNTRPEMGLFEPDLDLLASRLPEPYAVALLVKPHVDKAFDAAFLVRKNNSYTSGGRGAFPFRRFDLGGGASPGFTPQVAPLEPPPAPTAKSRILAQSLEDQQATHPEPPVVERRLPVPQEEPLPAVAAPAPVASAVPLPIEPPPVHVAAPLLPGWALALLAAILAGAGVLGGYLLAANKFRNAAAAEGLRNYSLGLHATNDADYVILSWDTTAPAFRDAVRGLLTIDDGDNWKTLTIESADLSRGRVRYRPVSKQISFRLDVLMDDHAGATEVVAVTRP